MSQSNKSYRIIFIGIFLALFTVASATFVDRATAQDSTFTVTVEDESTEHPRYDEGFSEKFAIDGSQNPQLTLERGKTYYFIMDGVPEIHPFYLTTDPEGFGAESYEDGVSGNGASGNDTLVVTLTADAPNSLYYQCVNHSYMGTEMSITGDLSTQPMVFRANLSGNQQVSPVVTRARGSVEATLEGMELTVTGSFDQLSSSYAASHIHVAYAGQNGGVEIPLDVTVDGDEMGGMYEAGNNSYLLTSSQRQTLLDRRMYVNVHSSQHPGGELRGQLLPDADAYYRANMTGNEVAPFGVKSQGHGAVVAELHGDSLKVSGAFSDMPSAYTMSHIHMAVAGQNGGVEHGLTANLSSSDSTAGTYAVADNSFELTSAQQTALQERSLYINLHTTDRPASALRGQLVGQSRATFLARLSSSNQSPSFNTGGNGTALLELHDDTLKVHGSFNDLESDFASGIAETGTHLHTAPAGRNGSIGIHLTAQASSSMRAGVYALSDNMYELTTDQIDRLFNREYYVNVHSQDNPGGSVRGQVLGPATAYFRANLSGTHEVQPVNSAGSGAVVGELYGNTLILTGSFQGLGSSFAAGIRQGSHLHAGGIDANGGIEVELSAQTGNNDTSAVYMASDNTFTLSSSNRANLFDGNLYANIHSQEYTSGELRGQLRFSPNQYPDTAMISSPADSASITFEGSASTNFTADWNSVSDTDGSQIAYIWQLSGDATFDSTMWSMNVGSNTSASISYGVIDSLLADAGVMVGGSTTLHHRVLSSDGSLIAQSESRAILATRGEVIVSIPSERDQIPEKVELNRNYPNPFNPSTTIQFGLPQAQNVTITVYNSLGREVATVTNKRYSAGRHTVTFDGSGLSSGIYLYRLQTRDRTLTRKMTLIK